MERKCIRCGAEMTECGLKLDGCAYGLQITKDPGPFEGEHERPTAMVCPVCGEVSVFVKNPEMFKK